MEKAIIKFEILKSQNKNFINMKDLFQKKCR